MVVGSSYIPVAEECSVGMGAQKGTNFGSCAKVFRTHPVPQASSPRSLYRLVWLPALRSIKILEFAELGGGLAGKLGSMYMFK